MITLSLLHPLNENPVQHWTFEEESVIRIGRSTDNNVVLYSAVVSRYHVEIRHGKTGWEVINLGTNGTYLDGKRVTQVPVTDGIIIRLARSGPNIQISVGQDGHEAVKALMRLKSEVAAHREAASTPSEKNGHTGTHPAEKTLTSDDEPTSGRASP
ncbi:MAG: FHA domain-containing protein [Leptolyngbya sp. RL_3_1]|nr:FHA domain-containing protein [Leptolyngbya sp. RL_3_1]